MTINVKKIAAAVCACVLCLSVVGCSNKDSSSSKNENTSSVAEKSDKNDKTDSKADDSNGDNSNADDSSANVNEQGELITNAAKFFDNPSYTLKTKLTTSDGSVVDITKAVSGDNIYQLQKTPLGTSGFIRVDGQSYDFDNVCGIYRKTDTTEIDGIVESVVKQNLPRTYGHISPEDEEKYNVEEYTYTGDTFITVVDFFFDKDSGDLKSYTATYSVEGSDDTTESWEVVEMTAAADDTLFNAETATKLMDFDGMTEDQRLGYCQGVCGTAGVSTDEMYEFGIDTDKLKTISYDDFVELIYTYGYNDQ